MGAGDWRARLAVALARPQAKRPRAIFDEINPHLVDDARFRARRTRQIEAAVLAPIVDRPEGPSLILTLRAPDMPSHAGQISFPGGRVHEADDGPIAAALREAHEEIGLSLESIEVLGALGPHHGGLGFSVTPVVARVDPAARFSPCPREVAEIFEVPFDYLIDLKNHYTEEREHDGVKYLMPAAPYDRFHIWGLTAGILKSLAELMENQN